MPVISLLIKLITPPVSTCIWDYYYSLQGYDYNSEEYHKKRSEVLREKLYE